MSPGEKRKEERVQPLIVRCRVLEEGRAAWPAYVTELSLAGARVSCEVPPPAAGTRLVLELDFGPGQARPRLPAELRWSATSGRGHTFGVSFAGHTGEEQVVLAATLDEFRRRAALLQ